MTGQIIPLVLLDSHFTAISSVHLNKGFPGSEWVFGVDLHTKAILVCIEFTANNSMLA